MTCSLVPREILWHHISKTRRAISLKVCMRNAFMDIMTHPKFHFNQLMLTLTSGIRASEPPPPPPPAWRTTEKAGPDKVKIRTHLWECTDVVHLDSARGHATGSSKTFGYKYRYTILIALVTCLDGPCHKCRATNRILYVIYVRIKVIWITF